MRAHHLIQSVPGVTVRHEGMHDIRRSLPEETPTALVFDGTTAAVMMTSPSDVEDFAIGFALTEGFICNLEDVMDFEVVSHAHGIEARFWLAPERAEAVHQRRRNMLGPVGCGLCGIDSLEQALRPLPVLPAGGLTFSCATARQATDALRVHQPLHDQTRAVHAAGFMDASGMIVLAREDVGRHNALDKLIGAMLRRGIDPATGAIVLTSRVSVEMVQKTVIAGCPVLIAVSAPTAHALRLAEGARLTLAAFARGGSFDIYAHPERIQTGACHAA
ncbi:FdhD protein [Roseovarius nanhaiticus]|uniref:Sulfur carrier protein FdhD n=1 Tax=Roseovarius nanhaiticus TaxID=573024 RepID=A0A1N7GUC5_9RHOB|nr:formate dehydrogenase accessory sulfurtransferase FdhD [Roseovarius nanhaiticus]SEL30645.1 FdhD protein [Roseovarius nanhaiticus]SIS16191.1 FdhD protein [Roseovarius nanhaiticus]